MMSLRDFINEASPPSKEAEDWIKSNKEEFKKQYGEDWESVLYATAWKMFGKKEDVFLEGKGPLEYAGLMIKKVINSGKYNQALATLLHIVKDKQKQKAGPRHDLAYYSLMVARQFDGVDNRELEKMARKKLQEDTAAPTNTTDGAASPDAKPLFKKGKFAGVDCIEVDGDTYARCKFGKKPYSRWSGVVEDEALRSYVQSHFNKSKQLMVMDSVSGAMVYIKR